MSERIDRVTSDLQKTADDVRASFSGLSAEQLNWKPDEKSWSVAQCLEHLIASHGSYVPLFDRLSSGQADLSYWEKISPFSGYFGRFLIKSLDPTNLKKMKAPGKAQPSASEIGKDIVDRFCDHQRELIDGIRKVPESLDATKTIITSPLLGIVTYSLDDCYSILVVHCQRHTAQAKRVTENTGFPKTINKEGQ